MPDTDEEDEPDSKGTAWKRAPTTVVIGPMTSALSAVSGLISSYTITKVCETSAGATGIRPAAATGLTDSSEQSASEESGPDDEGLHARVLAIPNSLPDEQYPINGYWTGQAEFEVESDGECTPPASGMTGLSQYMRTLATVIQTRALPHRPVWTGEDSTVEGRATCSDGWVHQDTRVALLRHTPVQGMAWEAKVLPRAS